MTTLNFNDYTALKALYEGTNGASWTNNSGWKDWDFTSATPPELSVVENWRGVTLEGDRVTELVLRFNQLSGKIPAELGNLTNLQSLDLDNNQLSGEIPAELGNLTNLQELYLYGNQLSGEIPIELSNLTNLQSLYLFGNQLSGEIPTELSNLTNLQSLSLWFNQLSGEIPIELSNLTNLQSLYLFGNQLSGEIPTELSSLTNLRSLSLGGNQLSGEIPVELGNLANLRSLYLSDNQLSGKIPVELSNLANLEYLELNDNQLSDEISTELRTFIQNLSYAYIQSPPYEIGLTDNSVDEHLEPGSFVGGLKSKDLDSEDEFSYELVSGEGDTDNALFEIVDGELYTRETFDYETKDSYSIRVQTDDDNDGTFEQQLTIYINDSSDEEVIITGDLKQYSILTAEVFDPDGIASPIEFQWQSSKNGKSWTDIAGATDETLSLTNEEVGRHIQVNVSYTDNDGKLESITAAAGEMTFNPTLAGTFDNYYNNDASVVVVEDYAYIANGGLEIVDISNPQTPTVAGIFYTNGYAQDVSVVGNYAYIADDYNGLEIINVSNPENPILVGSYETEAYDGNVSVLGDYAYITDYETLEIIDISNPQTPTLAGTYKTDGYAQDISVVGNYAYIHIENEGLQIVDVSDPQTPSLASTFYIANSYNDVYDIAVAGDYAYIANDNWGLKIVDISNPQNPREVEGYSPNGSAVGVAVAGDYAYITNDYGDLEIVDISDPENPTFVGNYYDYDTYRSIADISVVGDYAYISDDDNGLQIIDTQPQYPLVENINDEPTGITLNNTRIAEQSKTGRVVGRLSTVDPDKDDSHTYTLIDDAGGRFALSEDNNKLVVANGSLLDAGSDSSHVVTIKTTDSGGYSYYEEEITIDVIEVVKPKGDATDNFLEGTSAIDIMKGLAGDDILEGYADNDILNGGTGADLMIGGTGDDAYFVDDTGDQVIEAVDEGIDRVISYIDYILPENVEKLILRGNERINGIGNDLRNLIKGNDADNIIEGKEGNDRLFGNGGNDELFGGAGQDILAGGDGFDILTGGDGRDRFILSDSNYDDLITDFQDGKDRLKLEEDLTFEDLEIEPIGFNNTNIWFNSRILVTLEGVDASLITSEDFI